MRRRGEPFACIAYNDGVSELYSLVIVDDERVIRDGLAGMIDWQALGFRVDAVLADGREALAKLDEAPVDAVLTDIRMTFVSGLDLAREIRSRSPRTRVVLLSGYREFEFAKQAVAAGVHDYLLKPLDFAELRRVFRGIAGEIAAERAAEVDRRRAEKERRRDRLLIEQQFYEQLLAGADAGAIDEHYARAGLPGALRGRPCALLRLLVVRSHRHRFDAQRIVEVFATCAEDTRIVRVENASDQVPSRSSDTGRGSADELTVFAHAAAPQPTEVFGERICAAARETASGIASTLGVEIEVEIPQVFPDLYAAAGARGRTASREAGEGETTMRSAVGAEESPTSTRRPDMPAAGTARSSTVSRAAAELVDRAVAHMEDHYRDSIGLQEVACALNVSAPYLSRVFRSAAGMTFIDYLTRLRMDRARELLVGGSMPVNKVAASVGYRSASHFSRTFKDTTGYSPEAYRRRRGAR